MIISLYSHFTDKRFRSYLPIFAPFLVGGILALFVAPIMLELVMPLRRPVQNWMVAKGLGAWAGKYGMLNLQIPDIALSSLAGVCCGIWGGSARWVRTSTLFAAGYLLIPYAIFVLDGTFSMLSSSTHIRITVFAWNVATCVPFAITGAWLGSRTSRLRSKRRLAGLCPKCGYDLRATTENRCPECGEVCKLHTEG